MTFLDLTFHLTAAGACAIGAGLLLLIFSVGWVYMSDSKYPEMTHERAVAQIMEWFQAVERDLVGNEVTTVRGARGVVADIRLDNDHGLMFTFEPGDHVERRFYPVSTIRSM